MPNRPGLHGHNLPDESQVLRQHDDGLPPAPGHGEGGILERDLFGQAPGEHRPETWRGCHVDLPGSGWVPATARQQVRDVHGWWAWVEVYQPAHRFLWVHQSHLRPGRERDPDPLRDLRERFGAGAND